MSKRKLIALLMALAVLSGLWAYRGRLFPKPRVLPPPPVVQVEPPSPAAQPPSNPVPVHHGLIDVVDEEDVASSNGDVHIRTTAGTYYDFQLVGEFVASKSSSDDFEVQVRQSPWQGTSRTVSTNTAVAMNVAGDRIGFYVRGRKGFYVNGQPTVLNDPRLDLPKGGKLIHESDRFAVVWPDGSEIQIKPHGDYLDFVVDLANTRSGKVSGLLGSFSGDRASDLRSRDGKTLDWTQPVTTAAQAEALHKMLYDVFGNSWRINQAQSLFDYDPGESTSTYTDLNFPYQIVISASLDDASRAKAEEACKQAGVRDIHFLDDCIFDLAVTGDLQFAASALQAQADVKLPEGFNCRPLAGGGDKCTNYEPSLADAQIGSSYQITIETMVGDVKQIEPFDCTKIDSQRRVSCVIKTKGRVFAGSNAITRYTLSTGEPHEDKGTMQPH